ncbi:sensor histidine kinase [Vogesella indigofera]|uniref:sensor histidine kinase n=1 Tax=Vogesella indigofera TaxID=45465 RepID=UPI00234F9190|nr:ATP-binding protein [Vogesella indigofera]MDC7700993.1 ATP-binding protein [Vogesella indigofera]
MRYPVIATAFGFVLLYLLAISTGNTSKLAEYYWWVFGLNAFGLVGLLAVVARQMLRLRRRVKSREFGAKLTQKLVVMFTLIALLPGMLVFTVSAQFLTRSIESWFNVEVENALDRGLELGRNALGFVLSDLSRKSRLVARDIADYSDHSLNSQLLRMREQLGVQEIAVYNQQGRLLSFAGPDDVRYLPRAPDPDVLRSLRQRKSHEIIDSDPDGTLELKVLLSYRSYVNDQTQIIQIIQPAPVDIARDAELIEDARAEYRQLVLSRDGLKTFYMLTLALVFLLALTAALAFALFISERLSAPLSELAAGTRAVAQGDFSKRHPVYRKDELGILTTMFNRMTQQLDEARLTADESRRLLESGKLYLESILANLSTGVIAFDYNWQLRAANTSASRILGVDFGELSGHELQVWPVLRPELSPLVETILREAATINPHDWQQQIDYLGAQGPRQLVARGAILPEQPATGYVVVFDDITELGRAQRDAAWGEVAKRLAHEIRNPLTPIQLSAERLAMKLADKLQPSDAEMLKRATDTIIKQVTALKGMVDAFRDYARAPKIKLVKLELNTLLREVLVLYESNPALKVDLSLQALPVMGDAALLRQVLHNLLQNAQDAILDADIPMIQISTRLEGRNVLVCVEDNGVGFSPDILPRAFEPYVTNKAKGTGLGLAVVKKIVEEHHGQITLANAQSGGARILLTLPLLEA